MEIKFWKHKINLIANIVVFFLIFPFFIIGIIKSVQDTSYLVLSITCLLILLIVTYYTFFDEHALSKITFSQNGFEITHIKKRLMSVNWSEINNIKRTPQGLAHYWLSFVINDKQIDVELTNKMYTTIMALCPREDLKPLIENVYFGKTFPKK